MLKYNLILCCHDDYLPTELNVFVDAGGDAHGDYCVIPGTDEHKRQAQTHTQERQSPVGDRTSHIWPNCEFQPASHCWLEHNNDHSCKLEILY